MGEGTVKVLVLVCFFLTMIAVGWFAVGVLCQQLKLRHRCEDQFVEVWGPSHALLGLLCRDHFNHLWLLLLLLWSECGVVCGCVCVQLSVVCVCVCVYS